MITLAVVLLLFLGFGLILVEFFITPGFIVGIIGAMCIIYAIYFGYEHLPSWQAHLYMLISAAFSIFMTIKLFTGNTYANIANKDAIYSKSNQRELLNLKIGDQGVTISALRPSGNAMFNDLKCEVLTEGDFVYTNSKVEIIKIDKDKIFVKSV